MPIVVVTPEERIGTLLGGKYQLESILGQGGMGVVFAATNTKISRPVAIKMLLADSSPNSDLAQRFLHEASSAAALRHPNVVEVLDRDQDSNGTPYVVLERLWGESLATCLERERVVSVAEAYRILIPVMSALCLAHQQKIIHRDLKPDNIFLAKIATGQIVPKILDFGIAKVAGATKKTGTGVVMGTPEYMSPEQAEGFSSVGASADVWSIGVVWFEALTGRLPFTAPTPTAMIIAISTTDAPKVASLAPHVPPEIAAAVDVALCRNRAERYQTMDAFVAALQNARDAVVQSGLEKTLEEVPIQPIPLVSASPIVDSSLITVPREPNKQLVVSPTRTATQSDTRSSGNNKKMTEAIPLRNPIVPLENNREESDSKSPQHSTLAPTSHQTFRDHNKFSRSRVLVVASSVVLCLGGTVLGVRAFRSQPNVPLEMGLSPTSRTAENVSLPGSPDVLQRQNESVDSSGTFRGTPAELPQNQDPQTSQTTPNSESVPVQQTPPNTVIRPRTPGEGMRPILGVGPSTQGLEGQPNRPITNQPGQSATQRRNPGEIRDASIIQGQTHTHSGPAPANPEF